MDLIRWLGSCVVPEARSPVCLSSASRGRQTWGMQGAERLGSRVAADATSFCVSAGIPRSFVANAVNSTSISSRHHPLTIPVKLLLSTVTCAACLTKTSSTCIVRLQPFRSSCLDYGSIRTLSAIASPRLCFVLCLGCEFLILLLRWPVHDVIASRLCAALSRVNPLGQVASIKWPVR